MGQRQQKRASERAVAKAAARKAPSSAKKQRGDDVIVGAPLAMKYGDLSDRQQRGVALWQRAQVHNGKVIPLTNEIHYWFSETDETRNYTVERNLRNFRGTMVVDYTCNCYDTQKESRVDCKHIFADKLFRGEIVVADVPKRSKRSNVKKAKRRPARKRFAHDGRTVRSAKRSARRNMPERIPELVLSLSQGYARHASDIIIPIRPQLYKGGRKGSPLPARAAALVLKVASGLSASEMMSHFKRFIDDEVMALRSVPNENTISDWFNDERLTPILRELLRQSALPFRKREIGAIVDSSKVSQLMIAHAKEVEYGNHDKRPGADWMKAHTICGVETLVVMDVLFSGIYKEGSHDSNFLKPLVEAAIGTFPLEFLLGDKAYLSEEVPSWLAERGIQAIIPVKKRYFRSEKKLYAQPLLDLVELYDRNNNKDFHEVYRLRPKIECLFSVLKRTTGGYCWSRGRKREIRNANEPCVAWMNELICKFIYVNLRFTVELEEETGVTIDYLTQSRHFPAPDEPLLKKRAA